MKTMKTSLPIAAKPLAQASNQKQGHRLVRAACTPPYAQAALQLLGWWLCLILFVALAGCGPGTGGTGTGPVASGAGAASTISYGVGPALATLPTGGTATVVSPAPGPVLPPGAASPLPAGSATVAAITLLIEPERVLLQTRCTSFTSSSSLVLAATSETRVAGTYQTQRSENGLVRVSSIPANLFLLFGNGQADSDTVRLRIEDSAGNLLLGPLSLPRSPAAVGAAPPETTTPLVCP
jgi:hypothetical protein